MREEGDLLHRRARDSETQGHKLTRSEQMAVLVNMVQSIQELFADSELPCQGSVGLHSIEAGVDLRDTYRQQFL